MNPYSEDIRKKIIEAPPTGHDRWSRFAPAGKFNLPLSCVSPSNTKAHFGSFCECFAVVEGSVLFRTVEPSVISNPT
jgi:hypothetical protein